MVDYVLCVLSINWVGVILLTWWVWLFVVGVVALDLVVLSSLLMVFALMITEGVDYLVLVCWLFVELLAFELYGRCLSVWYWLIAFWCCCFNLIACCCGFGWIVYCFSFGLGEKVGACLNIDVEFWFVCLVTWVGCLHFFELLVWCLCCLLCNWFCCFLW